MTTNERWEAAYERLFGIENLEEDAMQEIALYMGDYVSKRLKPSVIVERAMADYINALHAREAMEPVTVSLRDCNAVVCYDVDSTLKDILQAISHSSDRKIMMSRYGNADSIKEVARCVGHTEHFVSNRINSELNRLRRDDRQPQTSGFRVAGVDVYYAG